MPREIKAESEVVQPRPATDAAITSVLRELCDAVMFGAMTGQTPVDTFMVGMQTGLVLALDHPEATSIVLASIDANSVLRDNPVLQDEESFRENRATSIARIADAALNGTPSPIPLPPTSFEWN